MFLGVQILNGNDFVKILKKIVSNALSFGYEYLVNKFLGFYFEAFNFLGVKSLASEEHSYQEYTCIPPVGLRMFDIKYNFKSTILGQICYIQSVLHLMKTYNILPLVH